MPGLSLGGPLRADASRGNTWTDFAQRGAGHPELVRQVLLRRQALADLHVAIVDGLVDAERRDLTGPDQLDRLKHELGWLWARMPHSRKAWNSFFTNCGRSAPGAAPVWAMKVAACCCTRRCSVVCSGR